MENSLKAPWWMTGCALMNGGMRLDVCESFPWRFRSFAKANLATLLWIKFIVLPHDCLLHFRWAETLLNFIEFSLFFAVPIVKKSALHTPRDAFPFFLKNSPFLSSKSGVFIKINENTALFMPFIYFFIFPMNIDKYNTYHLYFVLICLQCWKTLIES